MAVISASVVGVCSGTREGEMSLGGDDKTKYDINSSMRGSWNHTPSSKSTTINIGETNNIRLATGPIRISGFDVWWTNGRESCRDIPTTCVERDLVDKIDLKKQQNRMAVIKSDSTLHATCSKVPRVCDLCESSKCRQVFPDCSFNLTKLTGIAGTLSGDLGHVGWFRLRKYTYLEHRNSQIKFWHPAQLNCGWNYNVTMCGWLLHFAHLGDSKHGMMWSGSTKEIEQNSLPTQRATNGFTSIQTAHREQVINCQGQKGTERVAAVNSSRRDLPQQLDATDRSQGSRGTTR